MKVFNNPYFILISRLVVGFIFLSFSLDKIVNPEEFVRSVTNYQILPLIFTNIFALILPWIELLVGLMLILGVRLRANALISAVVMTMFIIAVANAWAAGLDINCGCSSATPEKVGLPKLLENTGLLVLSLFVYFFPQKKFTLESFVMSASQTKNMI